MSEMSTLSPLQGENASIEGNWCVTDIRKTSFSQTWIINNFKKFCEDTECVLNSSEFETTSEEILKCVWRLTLHPNGVADDEEYISLFLTLKSCSRPEVRVSVTLSILSGVGVSENYTRNIKCCDFFVGGNRGFEHFIELGTVLDPSNGLMDDGKLRVRCEIFFNEEPSHITGVNTQLQVPKGSLSKDLVHLLDSKEFCDVILRANNGREFHAHKCILCARSHVFQHMFQVNMKESIENRVELDMSDEVLESILCYLYTDEFKPIEKMEELLKIAEMYDLGRLKAFCEKELSSKLTVDTVSDILLLADTHRADHLRQLAVSFVVQNSKRVLHTKGWKSLMSKMPEVVRAIIEQIVYY